MKLHLFIYILMATLISDVQADYSFFPKFEAVSLSEHFPHDPKPINSLLSVKRYDYDLDLYREIILKQYKSLIFKHIDDLVSLKKNIIKSYRIKKINKEKYIEINDKIYREYNKFSGQGYHINNYLLYYGRYGIRKNGRLKLSLF